MTVDTSAIVQILLQEQDWERLARFINDADNITMSAASLVELYIVMEAKKRFTLLSDVDDYLQTSPLQFVPFTQAQARIARDAFLKYGRGSGSKAKLNFGDCFSYALAMETGEPLLFVGNDFIHTDILPALDPPVLSPE